MTKDEMIENITDSMDLNLSKLQKIMKNKEAWRAAENPAPSQGYSYHHKSFLCHLTLEPLGIILLLQF